MQSPVLSREEEIYWLALKLVPGLGSRTAAKLLDRFRTPQAVFRASRTELEGSGVNAAVAQSIASGCTFEDAATQQEKMLKAGAVAVTFGDPSYPAPLRDIFDPPLLLFARGRLELLQTVSIAVVGTRRPTPYGLAGDLAHAAIHYLPTW
jgi:DNA processing protein